METKLQEVECPQCAGKGNCGAKPERYRMVVMAWAHGRQVSVCPGFAPRWYRGVDGVIDFPRAPAGRMPS